MRGSLTAKTVYDFISGEDDKYEKFIKAYKSISEDKRKKLWEDMLEVDEDVPKELFGDEGDGEGGEADGGSWNCLSNDL